VIWFFIMVVTALLIAALMAAQSSASRPRAVSKGGLVPKFHLKVSGVSHRNADGSSRQKIIERCHPGEIVLLIREPENRYDADAIRVCRQSGEQIGYVPAEHSAHLGEELDISAQGTGRAVVAFISQIRGGTASKPTRGVAIGICYLPGPAAKSDRPKKAN